MTVLHYVVPGAREGEIDDRPVLLSAFPLRRRWVHTGGDCEHCGQGWRLFWCPLCPAAVCLACAALLPQRPLLEGDKGWHVEFKRWLMQVNAAMLAEGA